MNELVLPLEAVRQHDVPRVGGKAAVLGTLLEAGFPVPRGVCLTTATFHLALAPHQDVVDAILRDHALWEPAGAAVAAAAIAAFLVALRIPVAAATRLHVMLPSIAEATTALAVRSSSTAEDLADRSFAGHYASMLGVRGEAALEAAILQCWRSSFSAHVLHARAMHGGPATGHGMAVLIQGMVDAECAGVCFSVDPVQHRPDQVVIDAAWGLGLGTVDGSVRADHAVVRREGWAIAERHVVEKPERIVLDPTGGVRRVAVPEDRRRAACLPEGWLQRIGQFAVAAEVLLGSPQDVEWAIADQRVWLLQSRPITTLPAERATRPAFPVTWEHDADRRHFWRLGDDPRQGIVPPLEQDVLDVFWAADKEMLETMGSDAWYVCSIVNGRRYVTTRPNDLQLGDVRIRRAAFRDLHARLWQAGMTSWEYWGPEIITATARLAAFDCERAGSSELAAHVEDALGALRRHWVVHYQLFLWPEPPTPFSDAFAKVSGLAEDAAASVRAQLVDGEETPLTRLIDGLYALGYAARDLPAVATLLRAPPEDVLARLAALPEAEPFRALLDALLHEFGDRTGSGFGSRVTLRTPTWRERPELVLRLAAPYFDAQVEPPAAARARARAARDLRMEQLCSAAADPVAVLELRRWLPLARKWAAVLEEHNHYIDQMALGQLRGAIRAAARRLVERGVLDEMEDVFWLQIAELLVALRREAHPSVAAMIAERKARDDALARLTPPPLLGVPDAALDERPGWKDERTPEDPEDPTRLTGQAASPGRYHGRARVVPESAILPDLQPVDILVAENAGPLWTPLFPILGGLVLDGGVPTQHAATTAREYGVPAVLGTKHATRRIHDGAWVTVDGTAGIVEL